MNILRLTRHSASEAQLAELVRIYGEGNFVAQVSETLPMNGREAVKRFDELAKDFEVVEAVLPVNLLESVLKLSNFCKSGGQVIKAITERELQDDGSVQFKFSHYVKMVKAEVVTEQL